MSEFNKHKTNSDSGAAEYNQSASESPFEKMLRAHNTTEQELDDLAERIGYPEAYRRLRISRDEVISAYNDSANEVAPDVIGGEKIVDTGISVNRKERASRLTAALKEFSGYSRLNGFGRALYTPHVGKIQQKYDDEKIGKIIKGQQARIDRADKEFHRAFGAQAMIDGGVDPVEVKYEEDMQSNEFISKYIGPDNEKARTKFRSTLKKQMK